MSGLAVRTAAAGAVGLGFALAAWCGSGIAAADTGAGTDTAAAPLPAPAKTPPRATRKTAAAQRALPAPRSAKAAHQQTTGPAHPLADFVRRLLFNQAPVPGRMGSGQVLDNGQVRDSGLAVDPEDDPISYTVTTAPHYGTVSVSPDGAYIYTPGADFTGVDTFTVALRDLGFHINLLDLFGSRRREVTVTVRAGSVDPTGIVIDNFEGAAGSLPDSRLWNVAVGAGWDASQATYSDSPENVRLDGQGHLVIQARNSGGTYTSGFLYTKDKLEMMYGTLTARIKFPAGQGLWPAFWMLGATFARETWNATDETGWPGCGEIDIMELANSGSTYHVTLHGPGWKSVGTTGAIEDLSSGYHDYWVRREPDLIAIGVDDTTLGTFTPAALPVGGQWVFDKPMFAILDLAVGGGWTGPPDGSTGWPATMLVDSLTYTPANKTY